MKSFKEFLLEREGSGILTVHNTTLERAKQHVLKALGDFKLVPDFDREYNDLQKIMSKTKRISRSNMPRVPFAKIGEFTEWLKENNINHKSMKVSASKLKPLQREIHLDVITEGLKKHGAPKNGSSLTKAVIVISKDMFITDGHHRWATAMLVDDKIKMSVIKVDAKIDDVRKLAQKFADEKGFKSQE